MTPRRFARRLNSSDFIEQRLPPQPAFQIVQKDRRHRVEAAHAHTVVRHAPGTTPRLLKAAFVGLWLGVKVRARIGAGTFQRALFVVFIGLGVANLVA